MTIPTPVKPKHEKLREERPETRVQFSGLSEVGQVRAVNQDSFWVDYLEGKGFLAVVADGMGGHKAGEIASQKAVSVLSQKVAVSPDYPPVAMARAVQSANEEIYGYALENPDQKGMGTTLSALYIDDQVGVIAHIGDSRAYLIRNDEIRQLTQDHSWVAERVRLGIISEEEARNHRWRNVITNALGANPEIKLDIMNFTVEPNDRFLLCSDGITTLITDEDIARIVSTFLPHQAVEELIDRANDNGSPDNVTAIVAQVEHVENTPKLYVPYSNYEYITVKIKDATSSGIEEIVNAYPEKQEESPRLTSIKNKIQDIWRDYTFWIVGGLGTLCFFLILLLLL